MSQPCRIFIIENSTGQEREKPFFEAGGHWDWDEDEYIWTDGNYGCDCNRGLFFTGEHQQGRCQTLKYSIRVVGLDGSLLYEEGPTGEELDLAS